MFTTPVLSNGISWIHQYYRSTSPFQTAAFC